MPPYDLVMILKNAAKPEIKEVLKRVVGHVHTGGGRVGQLENLGTSRLPYRMKKHGERHTEGFYMIMEADLPADSLTRLKAVLHQDKGIIRPNIVRQEVEAQRPCEVGECFFGELTTTQNKMFRKFGRFEKLPV